MIIPTVPTRAHKILLFLSIVFSATVVTAMQQTELAGGPDLNAITSAVDKRYDKLHSLKAEFDETYRAQGAKRSESGTLWLERGGKMRWEYTQPQQKLFVSDGRDAYFYIPGDTEAQKTSMKRLDDMRSPLRYLLGKTRLQKEFDQLTAKPGANGDVLLDGIPKSMSERIASVQLEISKDNEITAISIAGTDGSVTEFHFNNVVTNPQVNNDLFRFVPPAGVEVVDSGEVMER